MADLRGRIATLECSTDGSSDPYQSIGGVKELGNPLNNDTIDTTDMDSNGWREFLDGLRGMTFSANGNYDEADTGFQKFVTSARAHTALYYRYRPSGDNSGVGQETLFQAYISSFEQTNALEDAAQFSFELQVTGEPTFQTQP